VATVKVIGTWVVVGRALREEMVDRPEHRVRDRHYSLLVSTMPHDASVPRPQRAVLGPDRRRCSFDEGGPQPSVALAGLPRRMLTGTLVIAGTERGPAGQMPITREEVHVYPEFGDDHLGRARVDPGMMSNCSTCAAKGVIRTATSSLTAVIDSFR